MRKGEITVFLSLVFIILLSFIGAMIESAAIQVSKNYCRMETDRALESVFAEYQIELLEEYDIFAVEASYESGVYSEENIIKRLGYYGNESGIYDITAIQMLTDNRGQAFREQILAYMEHKLGASGTGIAESRVTEIKEQERLSDEFYKEEKQINEQLETELSAAEAELPEENNPLSNISKIKQSNLLNLVYPNQEQLSHRNIILNELPSHRVLQKGRGYAGSVAKSGALSNILISQYILEHFQGHSDKREEGGLLYQLEYLLIGSDSDQKNLEGVVKKLIAIRFAANYTYLLTDSVKKAEAEALALSLCTVLSIPVITTLVKQAILMAWAYGESLVDVRSLLKNNKVALLKSDSDWQLSLSGLMTLGTAEDNQEGKDMDGGVGYKEYLRMLLLLEKENILTMRMLDLMELELRTVKNLSFFKVDYCFGKIEIESLFHLPRRIEYLFKTKYCYQ